MGLSDFLWDEMLDHAMNDGAYTAPTWYAGLSTTDPLADGSGVTEPTGNNYARVSTAASDWNASSGEAKTNANAITFPEASGSWGEVGWLVFYDAATDGNFLGYGALTSAETIIINQVARFPAASISVGKA